MIALSAEVVVASARVGQESVAAGFAPAFVADAAVASSLRCWKCLESLDVF